MDDLLGVCVRVRGQPPLPLKWGSDSGVQWTVATSRHPPSLATTTTTANGCVAFILPAADGDIGAKKNKQSASAAKFLPRQQN